MHGRVNVTRQRDYEEYSSQARDVLNAINKKEILTPYIQSLLNNPYILEVHGNSFLYAAVASNYTEVIDLLLSLHTNIDHPHSALAAAASIGNLELMRKFISLGADVNNGHPLVNAARRNNLAAINCLLEAGAKIDQTDSSGQNAFMEAAIHGCVDIMRLLLEKNPNFLNAINTRNETALMQMMEPHHTVAEDADRSAAFIFLLEYNADVKLKNYKKQTAFQIAAEYLKYSKSNPQQLALIKTMLLHPSFMPQTKNDMDIALLIAVELGLTEYVDTLLSKGANVDAQDEYGNTALMLATVSKQHGIMRLLLQYKANIHKENKNKESAIVRAVDNKDPMGVKILCRAGAIKHNTTHSNSGLQLLTRAALKKHLQIVNILLTYGANPNPNSDDTNEITPLIQAVWREQAGMASRLLSAGARPNVRFNKARAGFYAAVTGNPTLVSLFKESMGPDDNLNKTTPLKYALDYSYHSFLKNILLTDPTACFYHDPNKSPLCGNLQYIIDLSHNKKIQWEYATICVNAILSASKEHETRHNITAKILDLQNISNYFKKNAGAWCVTERLIDLINAELAVTKLRRDNPSTLGDKVDTDESKELTQSKSYVFQCIREKLSIKIDEPLLNSVDDQNNSLITVAIRSRRGISKLISDLNTELPDANGNTALHIATQINDVGAAKLLLEHGANFHAENPQGYNALMLAIELGNNEIESALREDGADILFKNIDAKIQLALQQDKAVLASALIDIKKQQEVANQAQVAHATANKPLIVRAASASLYTTTRLFAPRQPVAQLNLIETQLQSAVKDANKTNVTTLLTTPKLVSDISINCLIGLNQTLPINDDATIREIKVLIINAILEKRKYIERNDPPAYLEHTHERGALTFLSTPGLRADLPAQNYTEEMRTMRRS